MSSSPTPSASDKASKGIERLRSALYGRISQTDNAIAHLNRVLATSNGTDAFLSTVTYTLRLLHLYLRSLSTLQLHAYARQVLTKALTLPPDTSIAIPAAQLRSAQLATSVRKLSSIISEARTFLRLWGLLGIWEWAADVKRSPPKDHIIRFIVRTQVLVNIFYQIFENGAYLAGKGVLTGWDSRRINKWDLWSTRCWAAHVFLDLAKLWRERVLEKQAGGDEKDNVAKATKERNATALLNNTWSRKLILNSAYAPLTIHWSLENGLVSDFWIGLLGSVTGIIRLRQAWKTTA
ncbi:hypothetical protein L228DRAFT_243506 [Xylona heveae TC161]|uniref:Peroxisomal biogenesis factor 11 n=1 Tax=Xylona heveae (strain CBS 132557 / TC161) TaxID=1328760 RepID=A0A165K3V2_XYLHT|nr:hypothetical protein L228DRAFT_243506 [Xylona heveae TC161]KZF26953.1 hypothetical protein L228DRAFT_243506 [Xylona heveae TC161]